jgi:hypothetical protein
LLHEAQNDATFVNIIIAEDESWCFQYDPQTKRQSAEWRSTAIQAVATMELTGIYQLLAGLAETLVTVY